MNMRFYCTTFIGPSQHRRILSFLVSPDSPSRRKTPQLFLPITEAPAYWIAPVERLEWTGLADRLLEVIPRDEENLIDPQDWIDGEYHPVPTIIDAAKELEAGLRTVREIAHSRAARHDVDLLTRFVDDLIQNSMRNSTHAICFITGVPGSGKTLVGLNLALASSDSRYPIHFMSGTGPLVKVLQAVLAKSHRMRVGCKAAEAEIKAKTLIENVHAFATQYFERDTSRPPSNHVVIFDEAQRAWNLEQNLRKFKRERSEPEMLLQIMERHQDWAVVIALVGGGQEINSGEAGLGEWGRALLEPHRKSWEIFASKEAIEGGPSVAGTRLFDQHLPSALRVEPQLHLDVAIRNLRADFYTRWVNHVLSGERDEAMALEAHKSFPIFLTRSLEEARHLLTENARGESRSGLVGSSKAARLRAEGLEPDSSFHAEYPWEHWYLSGPHDVRSCYQLEVFASEFEIQGLELDWVGVCWGGDYIWSSRERRWIPREFRMANSKWREMTREDQRIFRKNSYRVLLTRARQGIVLFVPTGDPNDPTRDPHEFDEVADFLLACGAQIPHRSPSDESPENTAISDRPASLFGRQFEARKGE